MGRFSNIPEWFRPTQRSYVVAETLRGLNFAKLNAGLNIGVTIDEERFVKVEFFEPVHDLGAEHYPTAHDDVPPPSEYA